MKGFAVFRGGQSKQVCYSLVKVEVTSLTAAQLHVEITIIKTSRTISSENRKLNIRKVLK